MKPKATRAIGAAVFLIGVIAASNALLFGPALAFIGLLVWLVGSTTEDDNTEGEENHGT